MMQVEWAKTADGDWFQLDEVPLSTLHLWGVYVVWVPNAIPSLPGTVLKVGSGNIAVRLAYERVHRLAYLPTGAPLVTWAEAEHHRHPGLVRYLTQVLHPVLSDRAIPDCEPIPVNVPVAA